MQLSRFSQGIGSSIADCQQLRNRIVDRLAERLLFDETLLQVLSSQRVDRLGEHIGEWDVWDNAFAELEQLRKPTEWGGVECIQEFCSLFGVRVRVMMPDGNHQFGDPEAVEQCVVFFNGVNHYDSVLDFESQAERRRMSDRKFNAIRLKDEEVVRKRVDNGEQHAEPAKE